MDGTIDHHDDDYNNHWEEKYEYNSGTRIAITLGFNMSK